jgi:serine/threonine protein phosphatase PrpC
MVVSDGRGGHAAGEVASALVVDSLRSSLGQTDDVVSMQRLIDQAVQRANADVFAAAKNKATKGMGATLTAVLVHGHEAYIAEVGDSRAYVLRQGRLRQMTRDQSFVQLLLDSGAITPEQAKKMPMRNAIVQAMGLEPNVHVAIGRLRLRRGDRLLLCCDGLYNLVSDDDLSRILGEEDLTSACDRMIDLANERGGDDNVTAVVARIDGDALPAPILHESVTQTFEVLQEFRGLEVKDPSRTARTISPSPPDAAPAPAVEAPDAPAAQPIRSTARAKSAAKRKSRTTQPHWSLVAGAVGIVLVTIGALLYWFELAR